MVLLYPAHTRHIPSLRKSYKQLPARGGTGEKCNGLPITNECGPMIGFYMVV
jgi:hypothetical protein